MRSTVGIYKKSMIIDIATTLFQQNGYVGVGLNEILKVRNLSKGRFITTFQMEKKNDSSFVFIYERAP
ncbi:hypothetical protein [Bacillus sp. V3B]|uniref:hypothetical protein n=1 Tax=Bacillus sp. V3B TaxID=2804915 RepID=UPI00210E24CD|nr:hypothetical protein [Bacillus sp. V3B]